MQDADRLLGHIIDYDPKTDVIMIKADFLEPDKQVLIEELFKNKSEFSFWFKKPFRKAKTYSQLRKYFRLLKEILIKSEIHPDAECIRTLDIEMKKSCLPCKKITIGDNERPIVPSKADLSVDDMSHLIQEVISRYGIE
jgi:DNA-binding GntR family transcriptional regulator